MPLSSAAYETACKAAVQDVICDAEARCEAGNLEDENFWQDVRRQLAERTAAALPHPNPPVANAAAAAMQPPDPVPAP